MPAPLSLSLSLCWLPGSLPLLCSLGARCVLSSEMKHLQRRHNKQQAIGILMVKVVGAKNLINADTFCTSVCVSLNYAMPCTNAVLEAALGVLRACRSQVGPILYSKAGQQQRLSHQDHQQQPEPNLERGM